MSSIADGSSSNTMHAQQRDEGSVGRGLRRQTEDQLIEEEPQRCVTSTVSLVQPAPASNRVNFLRGSHRCTTYPSRHQILQAARAWLRNRSAITAKVDMAVHAPTHAAPMIALRVRHP